MFVYNKNKNTPFCIGSIEFHLVCKFFFITVHKVNGEEYELDTLSGF